VKGVVRIVAGESPNVVWIQRATAAPGGTLDPVSFVSVSAERMVF
jgi:hypothetical protein